MDSAKTILPIAAVVGGVKKHTIGKNRIRKCLKIEK
jgi:hypothetical protein